MFRGRLPLNLGTPLAIRGEHRASCQLCHAILIGHICGLLLWRQHAQLLHRHGRFLRWLVMGCGGGGRGWEGSEEAAGGVLYA
jgi:hypothetical protein